VFLSISVCSVTLCDSVSVHLPAPHQFHPDTWYPHLDLVFRALQSNPLAKVAWEEGLLSCSGLGA
jgi:hypothetical protein